MMAYGSLKQVDRFVGIRGLKKCEPRCLDHADRVNGRIRPAGIAALNDTAVPPVIGWMRQESKPTSHEMRSV
jgi:hypothetical protein